MQSTCGNNWFNSVFERRGYAELPEFTGARVMMMPLVIGDKTSIPPIVSHYKALLGTIFALAQEHLGRVGYLTIDERVLHPMETLRRAGKHVDGIYQGRSGAWGGGGGGWGSVGTGMLTVSNPAGCLAWNQRFDGWPGDEGECEHLATQCRDENATLFDAGVVYWVHGLCVHESLPVQKKTHRQFVRLSLPSDGPWFEGYTENPLGIKPTGPILPSRKFMAV